MNLNDPAFGSTLPGTFALGTLEASTPEVAEAQRLLNALGFGPLAVDGILGPKTQRALADFYATHRKQSPPAVVDKTVLDVLRSAATKAADKAVAVVTTTTNASAPPKAFPWTPAVLVGGVALLALLGYLWWRSSQGSLGDDGEEESDDDKKRCRRTPDVVWESGTVVAEKDDEKE